MQHVGSCPIVCRGERGRETDRDDYDDDASADGDREEDEDEDDDHVDDNDTDDRCFFAEKRGEEMATKSRIKNVPGTGGMPAAFGGAGGRHLSQQVSVSPCLQGVPKK